jgi:hypothetical protein
MNWAQYACDTTHHQLKRTTRHALCGRPKLSLTITTQSTQGDYERIEGFHAKPNSINEKVVGKCRKCETKPPSNKISYAHRKGVFLIQSELLGDNFNSPK